MDLNDEELKATRILKEVHRSEIEKSHDIINRKYKELLEVQDANKMQ